MALNIVSNERADGSLVVVAEGEVDVSCASELRDAIDAALAKMVADEVRRQMAIREAQLLAEMGAPVTKLPAATGGSPAAASRVQYTMAELDAMPAMQRLEVLRKNPALAAAYAAHI
jgi:hypothetical protein